METGNTSKSSSTLNSEDDEGDELQKENSGNEDNAVDDQENETN